ncbi:MAG: sigma-54-dependent Fis family transcriptional regulator [Myxococcales bacterium]|nr:sigma-54-dependent Fis family transcriptional regulator [Myxococcales bacterium]
MEATATNPAAPADLLERLAGASDFEAAATELMRGLCERISQALRIQFGEGARVLRAVVHVRPAAEYSRAAVLQPTGADISLYAPSATTWRWVATHGCPVTVDVRLGTIALAAGSTDALLEEAPVDSIWETQRAWMNRSATHVLALPLLSGTETSGMLTLEIGAGAAVGRPLFERELVGDLARVVNRATPYLLTLPVRTSAEPVDPLLPVVGKSMRATIEVLRLFARQEDTLLLSGPTGAGKSQLARWVHAQSPRNSGPFEVVHLATRPEGLRMGELFGWRRGAFSGATHDYVGALGRAERGTVFLDEIDKLSLDDQAGLLRLLEENRYRPLGDARPELEADVRFVLGTNVDLEARVKAGTFREDLYYRVHVLPARVASLDERRDEIPAWARFMLNRRHGESGGGGVLELAAEAANRLAERSWPGNLRQLDNVIRRAYVLATSRGGGEPVSVLDVWSVDRALAFEAVSGGRSPLDLLRAAAEGIVDRAERSGAATMDLDLADGFRGLLLAVAAERLGTLDAAFRLFGRETAIKHRNHVKLYRKELGRLDSLSIALTGCESGYAVPGDDV